MLTVDFQTLALGSGQTLLDVGCGEGRHTLAAYLKSGVTAVGVDLGLVDLETMRSLDGFITAQGDVFRMQVVGHADRGGPVTRIEAVVDSTEAIPKVIFQRNLSELGPGYRSNQLIPFGE